jgi:hypothetical protein
MNCTNYSRQKGIDTWRLLRPHPGEKNEAHRRTMVQVERNGRILATAPGSPPAIDAANRHKPRWRPRANTPAAFSTTAFVTPVVQSVYRCRWSRVGPCCTGRYKMPAYGAITDQPLNEVLVAKPEGNMRQHGFGPRCSKPVSLVTNSWRKTNHGPADGREGLSMFRLILALLFSAIFSLNVPLAVGGSSRTKTRSRQPTKSPPKPRS